jgi:hypothetical protein
VLRVLIRPGDHGPVCHAAVDPLCTQLGPPATGAD